MQTNKKMEFDRVHDTQIIFRELQDSMARPGKINNIYHECHQIKTPPTFSKMLAGLAFTLIDGEVSFSVYSTEQTESEQFLQWNTMSKKSDIEDADFIFINKKLSGDEIHSIMSKAKKGTLLEPHKSATILILVDTLSEGEMSDTDLTLRLEGPGIKELKKCYLSGLNEIWLEERKKSNEEYPLGVEMVLVSNDGNLFCLPRTTNIERG